MNKNISHCLVAIIAFGIIFTPILAQAGMVPEGSAQKSQEQISTSIAKPKPIFDQIKVDRPREKITTDLPTGTNIKASFEAAEPCIKLNTLKIKKL